LPVAPGPGLIEHWWGRIGYEAASDELTDELAAWHELVDRLPEHELPPPSPDRRPRRDTDIEHLFRHLRYVRDDLAKIIEAEEAAR
jgi:hypothetical protein